MNWYYVHDGKQAGPVPESELAQLASTQVIGAGTLVWREGMGDWQPASVALPSLLPGADAPLVGGVVIPASQKDLYVQQMREGVTATAVGAMQFGGFWLRFVAWFVDSLILQAAQFVVGLVIGITVAATSRDGQPNVLLTIIPIFTGLLMNFGYQTYMVGKYGATLGKMALNLKVVRADGGKVSTGLAAGRYFAQMLSGLTLCIGYIIAAFDAEKRALHDHICGTRVIKTR